MRLNDVTMSIILFLVTYKKSSYVVTDNNLIYPGLISGEFPSLNLF